MQGGRNAVDNASRLKRGEEAFRHRFERDGCSWDAIHAAIQRGFVRHMHAPAASPEDLMLATDTKLSERAADRYVTLPSFTSPMDRQAFDEHAVPSLSRHLSLPGSRPNKRSMPKSIQALIRCLAKADKPDILSLNDDSFELLATDDSAAIRTPLTAFCSTANPSAGVMGAGALERYNFEQEWYLQTGEYCTPGHIDHQHVLACMPTACSAAVKLWVLLSPSEARDVGWRNCETATRAFVRAALQPSATVVVMLPGDVLSMPPMVWHAVLTSYRPGTCDDDRWACIGGNVVMLKSQVAASFAFARSGCSGAEVLSAATARKYRDSVLRPFWWLYRRRGTYTDAAALKALRAVAQPPGSVSCVKAAAARAGTSKRGVKRKAALSKVQAMNNARKNS